MNKILSQLLLLHQVHEFSSFGEIFEIIHLVTLSVLVELKALCHELHQESFLNDRDILFGENISSRSRNDVEFSI